MKKNKSTLMLLLDPELRHAFKIAVTQNHSNMRRVLTEMITKYILWQENEKPEGKK